MAGEFLAAEMRFARPGGPSRTCPGATAARQGPLTAGRPAVWSEDCQPSSQGHIGGGSRPHDGVVNVTNGSTTEDLAEQAYKHRARDALGLADLRQYGLRQASMSRGVEARGSEHFCLRTPRKLECAPDPWRPARPRFFSRVAVRTTACPGPTKEYGRRSVGFSPSHPPRRRFALPHHEEKAAVARRPIEVYMPAKSQQSRVGSKQ